ncbi:GntR family transcriptional regulator [Arthrobacter woluwensis]|uniref:Transcriptional regulator, GntR family n=1 Tax=Arthrobacter woluwensis TaxID=156980 RepID=A0A1H4LF87_9MICC|nr:GntR family transcriptional regulator [Arthrobacter woluwensis]SEB69381.1 transcriptional regulator, GntR family [Arthrobacter woluwensis]
MTGSSSSQRIEDALRAAISSGRYAPGTKLPAERELAAELGVSRMTLRQAVETLQFQGILRRRPGRAGGTFVAGTAPVLELGSLHGLFQQLSRDGAVVESRILLAETSPAPAEVSEALRITPGDPAHRLRRLRFLDGEPLLIEDSWFPAERLPGFAVESLTGSVYARLKTFGWEPVRKTEDLIPSVATAEERDLLSVGARHPVLRIIRTAYRSDGLPVEFAQDTHRSDALRLRVTTGSS